MVDQIDNLADKEAWPIPGFRLIRRLGAGGYGEVWEAEGPGGFRVALKFVGLSEGRGDAELRALEILKHIRHPNLLVTFGSWHVGRHLIIGMELADRTLWDRFREALADGLAGIPRAELLTYIGQASKALDYLNGHRHALDGREAVGVQHRDVKPENILLLGGGVKVADFGLARLLTHSVASHTGRWTATYAAPEFFRRETSDRSDQYSLAVTYCHLRCGQPPFRGSPASVIAGHILGKPDLEFLPAEERPVVERALAKDPKDRWADCDEFVRELGEIRVAEETLLPSVEDAVQADRSEFDSCDSRAYLGTPIGSETDTFRSGLGVWPPVSDPPEVARISAIAPLEFATVTGSSLPSLVALTQPPASDPGPPHDPTGSVPMDRPPSPTGPEAGPPKHGLLRRLGAMAAVALALITGLGLSAGVRWPRGRPGRSPSSGEEVSPGSALSREDDRVHLALHELRTQAGPVPRRPAEGDLTGIDRPAGEPIDVLPRPVDDGKTSPPRSADKPTKAESGPNRSPDGGGGEVLELIPPSNGAAPRSPLADRPDTPPSDRQGAGVFVAASPAALQIDVAKGLTIPVGGHARLTVKVSREGNAGKPVTLRFEGVPSGVELRETPVPEGQAAAEVEVKADPSAAPGRWPVEVVGAVGTSRSSARWILTVEGPDAAEQARRGYTLLAGGSPGDALKAFGEAIRLDPRLAASFRGRGQVHYLLGRDAEAIADLDEAIRIDPADALALNNRGLVRLRRGDLGRATADLDEAIRLRPDVAAYRCNRGSAHRLRGDNERAAADYTEALRLNRSYVEALDGRAVVQIATKRFDRALADSDAALRLKPDDAAAHNSRGLALCQLGKFTEAVASYDKAARLRPRDGVVRYNRGLAHHQAGDLDAALADYDAAIGLDPKLDGPQQARRAALARRAGRPPHPETASKVGALRP